MRHNEAGKDEKMEQKFETFVRKVGEELEKQLGEGYQAVPQTFCRNNGVRLREIMITDGTQAVMPCICMEKYFLWYKNNEAIDDIVQDILHEYQSKVKERIPFVPCIDRDMVKKNTVFRLVNTEKNRELLEKVPHREVEGLDLSVMLSVMVDIYPDQRGFVIIRNEMLQQMGLAENDLWEAADVNTPDKMLYQIQNMADLLQIQEGDDCNLPMFVLSNEQKIYGAGCILYHGVKEKLAEMLQSDYYVLPSSVHEVIVIPADQLEGSVQELKERVVEVNRNEVSEQEFLSDSVYFYSRQRKELCIAA